MSENGNLRGIFELFDPVLAETSPDVLGLWTTTPISIAEAIAFNTTSATITDVPLWRANLPAELSLAAAELANGEARVDALQKTLNAAADRLDIFIMHSGAGVETGLVFDTSSTKKRLAQPERELLVSLQALQKTELLQSFSLGEGLVEGWQQAIHQFQIFVERLLYMVANYAWVETHIQGKLLARTAVSWTGDMDSVWQKGLEPEQVELHHRTLALALASRDTLSRTFALAAQGTLKLSVLLTRPTGTILALPAVWKFIHQVLTELGRYQDIKED